MDRERWQKIEALYQAARDPQRRAAVLDSADPDLRREIEALLARDDAGSTETMVGAGLQRVSYLPTLRALLAPNHGEPAKAVELLQVAAPYELGAPRSAVHAFFGAFYPVYARGEAYLAARQGTAAAAEFQKILDHPWIVMSDPIGALARLQLGRAFAMSGDTTKAKAAYQDFLTLWKDADADIPILKQAKAEYARL